MSYDEAAPWPIAANGAGASLERINWRGYGDEVLNWRASAAPGGTPGQIPAATFASWQTLYFTAAQIADPLISGADADPDEDGLSNLREFAHGLNPLGVNTAETVSVSSANDGAAGPFLTLRYRRSLSAQNVQFHVDSTDIPESWMFDASMPLGAPVNNGDGSETVTMRDVIPTSSAERRFLRLRIANP